MNDKNAELVAEFVDHFGRNDEPKPETRERGLPRGAPFPKGTSGNPNGRPRGARNKSTQLARALLEDSTKDLAVRAITLAREGNVAALKFCLDRVLPREREAPITIDLPPLNSRADCTRAARAVIAAAAAGEITLREAEIMTRLIDREREGPQYMGVGERR